MSRIAEFVYPTSRSISAFDLFAGAGGLSYAAQNLGIEIKGAVELDKNACCTYRHNIIDPNKHQTRLFEGDILDLDPHEVLVECGMLPGELDILVGGPPCQGFSRHRIKNAGVGDPRNQLLLRYFDFVREFKPRVFLLENVPGLLWPRHALYLDRFYELGREARYSVLPPEKINAKDYGVPQNRNRVFIVGFRESVPENFQWPPTPTHCDPKAAFKKGLLPWATASDVFETPTSKSDPNNIHMNHSEEMIQRFKNTPKNGGSRFESGHTLPCHKGYVGHRDVYGRIDPSKPGPTMTTGCTNPSKGRFVHPIENHGITIREAARLQSFPDDFVFVGGLGPSAKQIGNAVPIRLGQHLLSHLIRYIEK